MNLSQKSEKKQAVLVNYVSSIPFLISIVVSSLNICRAYPCQRGCQSKGHDVNLSMNEPASATPPRHPYRTDHFLKIVQIRRRDPVRLVDINISECC